MSASRLFSFVRFAAGSVCCAVGLAQHSAHARVDIPDAAQPQLANDSQGRVWLAYGRTPPKAAVPSHKDGGHAKAGGHGHGAAARPDGEIFVARSDDGGATFTASTKVANIPNLMLGNRRGPRIAVIGDQVTVTVMSKELLAFTSVNAGQSWSEPVVINDVPTSAREGLHDLAVSGAGQLFVTWLDLRNGKMELWGAFSTDGGRTWTRDEQVYRSPDKSICECCHPSALYDAEGNLAVMWRNSIEGARDMWMMTRAKGAPAFASPRKIGEGTWTLNACPMDGGRILAFGQGKFGTVWQRAGDVFFTPNSGPEVQIGKGKQPVAFLQGGRTVIVWQQGTDLVSGAPGGAAEPRRLAENARFPVIVSTPDGRGAVLAYELGPPKGSTSISIERM